MRRSLTAICASALLSVALSAITDRPVAASDDVLKVCLDEDLPPASVHRRGKPDSGFDVLLAQAVAKQLQRPLHIQWFETRLDEDSSPALEANALLSDGRCALLGGYALTQDSLVAPGVKTAKLPDFDGATRDDRRRRVPLGVLAPSRPYVYSALTVVLGSKAGDRHVKDLGDLADLRIGIESGTLADAILMNFDKGKLIDQITHLVPTRSDLLGELERGELDATLVDTRRLDAYRAAHPDSHLAASGYYYPIGVNRAYIGVASDGALIAAVDKVLADLEANGTIEQLAKTSGLTYQKPREPIILGDVLPQILRK
ncbi:transporter substrate-binding domain-containing protein [Bradyrhizobium sp.]|uniref:substrate-binding periplasmic protein n=1 Tax=Bradyrhizobium sp. TaxID=376 RepID=UPI002608D896|nr:transporter substrate-binding domain-containing protein [Bradyrhizobium sp.]